MAFTKNTSGIDALAEHLTGIDDTKSWDGVPNQNQLRMREGVIQSIDGTTHCTIALSGDTVNTISGVQWLSGYSPQVGDFVQVLVQGTYRIITGCIATGIQNWQAYTPAFVGPPTGVALGNGTMHGMYRQIGNVVHFSMRFVVGSTTTMGTSQLIKFTLPVTVDLTDVSSNAIGFVFPTWVSFSDATSVRPLVTFCNEVGNTTRTVDMTASPGTNIDATHPPLFWTGWSSAPMLIMTGTYQAQM